MRLNMKKPVAALLLMVLATGCQSAQEQTQRETIASTTQAGKALFEEKCRTVAGEKIYRTVQDVDGLFLMKVRPTRSERELADPMWPGAAFARESYTDSYITTFLGYEYGPGDPSTGIPHPMTPNKRGYINTDKRPGGLPGYRFVDMIDAKDGQRYRITGSNKAVRKKDTSAPNVQLALRKDPNYDLNVYSWVLDKTLTDAPSPRYAVTYEDHVIPEERAIGIASSTVRVIDLKTNEVLGEMIRYAWTHRTPSTAAWLTAYTCPGHAWGANAATRKFVDQILIPNREK
jgi:hypothetical protein